MNLEEQEIKYHEGKEIKKVRLNELPDTMPALYRYRFSENRFDTPAYLTKEGLIKVLGKFTPEQLRSVKIKAYGVVD